MQKKNLLYYGGINAPLEVFFVFFCFFLNLFWICNQPLALLLGCLIFLTLFVTYVVFSPPSDCKTSCLKFFCIPVTVIALETDFNW